MHRNPFSAGEIDARLARVRAELWARGLAAAVFAAPETVFWLTGLDHWGYFAPHLLVVPAEGVPVLVTRAMERVTIEHQVTAADFAGHPDSETAADRAASVLAARGLAGRRLGLETWTSGMSHGLARRLAGAVAAEWQDVSGLVDALRRVKSPEEQALVRRAAAVSRAAAAAALDAISDGAREVDVAAACVAAMIRAGGDPPGFGPFIRPGPRIGEEHATWGDGRFRPGERVFIELSGCVGRYHAPLGRLVAIGPVAAADAVMAATAARAFDAAVAALRPGARACDVYAAWQGVVDAAGLAHYRRHHCGYLVGVGVPPSWTGGNTVTGLRHDSDLPIEPGMTFHVLSWLMGTGRGDAFVSETVLVTEAEAEVLTAGD
ncbi:MAG TPA: Xaa-Pro peptidase family protein [Amaricoccus sp.]|nr:Xaa-Pro peptidase family protein [Amaricoccus sp.]